MSRRGSSLKSPVLPLLGVVLLAALMVGPAFPTFPEPRQSFGSDPVPSHAGMAIAGPGVPGASAELASPAKLPTVTAGSARPLVAAGKWFNLTASLLPSPEARFASQMAYDAKDGYTVLFSGANASGFGLTDTWVYRNNSWSQIFPAVSPSPRVASVMVYDPIDQYVVLFGGLTPDVTGVLSDTWTFAGGNWTNITAGPAPPGRGEAAATWDAVDQSVILVGGDNGSAPVSDTWRFVGGTWTELFPGTSPSARIAPGLAFDGADGYVVLFGGVNYTTDFSDTWRFVNGTWTQLFPAIAPPPRALWAMAYDPDLSDVVLFGGGIGNDSIFYGDTWTFHGGGWTQQFPTASPGARQFSTVAWDSGANDLVLYGGAILGTLNFGPVDDTWVFASLPVPALSAVGTAEDVGQSIAVSGTVTGGARPYNLTWAFDDGTVGYGSSTAHVYATAGSYNVTLTVLDALGQAATAGTPITVHARPTVALASNRSSVRAGENSTLSVTVTGGTAPFTYAWQLGDGRTATDPGPEVVRYVQAGSFLVNLSVTDGAGVTVSTNLTILVTAAPPAPSGSATSSVLLWMVVGAVAAIVVLAVVLLWVRRRRGRPPSVATTLGPPPAVTQPPSGPP